MKKFVLALLLALCAPAHAAIISALPFTLQNGTVADATQVMADFNQIVNNVNSNAAQNGANSDITSLTGLTTALSYTQGGTNVWIGGTSTGSANAHTVATLAPTTGFSLLAGKRVIFKAGSTNTGATTLNAASTGATNVFRMGPSGPIALAGGEIRADNLIEAVFDGTQYQLVTNNLAILGPLTTLSSAAPDLGTIPSHNISISGTTAITAFGSTASAQYPIYYLRFEGALTLTYNATSLILPSALNITTAANDYAVALYLGSGNWRVLAYARAAGTALYSPGLPPGGRLTLTTAVPVLVSDVTAAAAVYYTPYLSNQVPTWNGSTYVATTFVEQTLTLNNPNHVANSNYDVFFAGGLICSGPAWTSDTGRGTGAGTTQISYNNGFLANTVSITCRAGASTFAIGALDALYLGTFRTVATAQTEMTFAPTPAAGGTANKLYLWNMYNRVAVSATSRNATDNWSYTTATWHPTNSAVGSGFGNRISFLRGLNEDAIDATFTGLGVNSAGSQVGFFVGIGIDSTTGFSGSPGIMGNFNTTGPNSAEAKYSGFPGLGLHYAQELEYSVASGGTTWFGDNAAPTVYQESLQLQTRM